MTQFSDVGPKSGLHSRKLVAVRFKSPVLTLKLGLIAPIWH